MGNVLELGKWRESENPDRIHYEGLWEVIPMSGRKIQVKLHRTRYFIKSSTDSYFCEKSSVVYLYSKESFEYELEFFFPDKPYSRLCLKAITGTPFTVNGLLAEKVYLTRKDRVQIGNHFFHFPQTTDQESIHPTLCDDLIKSKLPIYLEGESGTGKSCLAKKIHSSSEVSGNFIQLNLASISSNLFESELFGHKKGSFTGAVGEKKGAIAEAHMGTLFLDEINSLSLEMQTKLLLVLENQTIRPIGSNQEIKVNFRLITSSNESLEIMVKEKRMRSDFYYRLVSGVRVKLPQINSSEQYFYNILNDLEKELDVAITRSLKEFYFKINWGGNIRELKNYLVKKKILQGRKLSYDLMDENLYYEKQMQANEEATDWREMKSLEEIKKSYVHLIFERCGRSVAETSRVLKVSPATVRASLQA